MNDPGALFFILMAGLAGTMTLIYFPLRIFLTATARSRRLRLLQRIRRLRDELGQPIENWVLFWFWCTKETGQNKISFEEKNVSDVIIYSPVARNQILIERIKMKTFK